MLELWFPTNIVYALVLKALNACEQGSNSIVPLPQLNFESLDSLFSLHSFRLQMMYRLLNCFMLHPTLAQYASAEGD
jgi:hypothetical protein